MWDFNEVGLNVFGVSHRCVSQNISFFLQELNSLKVCIISLKLEYRLLYMAFVQFQHCR